MNSEKIPFEEEIKARFKKWTGLDDPLVEESLKELTGDTYFEMRKLISQTLTLIEQMIESGMYCGYVNGKELTEDQKKDIKSMPEDFKIEIKNLIEASWRSIINKQKVGIDKLSLSIRPHLNGTKKED